MEKGGKSKRTRAVVDRIEDGGVAVLHVGEDEETKVELPASLLPEGTESGSHLVINVSLDDDSRKESEDRVKALQEKLEKRGGGGRKNFKL
ncbi:MAG: DUF3006 domain-containing protein [Acidobacteria bacterium]|nr:DUF3006 domain-containing protein [Acidobacteriota bacterium]MCA1619785.1 DUF3006 domain-containing protein [Acidobacteriota bacterium]